MYCIITIKIALYNFMRYRYTTKAEGAKMFLFLQVDIIIILLTTKCKIKKCI